MSSIKPTVRLERLQVVDALRGFALFGILFANLYSFIGYNTYNPNEILALPVLDKVMLFFIDWFVEGKFYSIFSILFGVGFALQADRFSSANENFTTFWFRRMIVLCCFGLIHMYFIWNGDILTLYAILGLLLPMFLNCSNKTLLTWILILLTLPLLFYAIVYMTSDASFWGSMRQISENLKIRWGFADLSLLQMRTSDQPTEVCAINVLKAIPRPMSYLMTGRYFHVLGLFLIGLLLARYWIPKIKNKDITVPKIAIWYGIIGLIFSFAYAITKLVMGSGYELSTLGIVQVVVYNIGSTSLALGIAMIFVYLWASGRAKSVFKNLAILGRMALTNYIFQNIIAVLLFFGYGFALMRKVPFAYLPLFAFGILLIQWLYSSVWLSRFKQGPLESIWRKLTYHSSKPN
ncbi:DUF418 domain-containing protein [Aquimarina atlantica]|nr:DUF418 domain-containing protein [Aquimarina atlantica]